MKTTPTLRAITLAATLLTPTLAPACACCCCQFEVGTSTLLPSEPGGIVYLNYNFLNQNHNWSGSSRAPADENEDRKLRTHFFTLGAQYLFSRSWGLQLNVPWAERSFTTQEDGEAASTRSWTALGDIRLKGIYTGFSEDLSTGLTFGIKLPTGEFRHAATAVDRDSQIGTGSTDLLIGAFHRQAFAEPSHFQWFTQAELDVPLFTQDHYRPGTELNATAGLTYTGWKLGGVSLSPVAQLLASVRTRDTGANSANPVASGYERLMLSAGIELKRAPLSIYLDAELPFYEHVRGNQIVASVSLKLVLGYHF